MMKTSTFWHMLKNLDYQGIANQDEYRDEFEEYVGVRSAIILGRYDVAKERLEHRFIAKKGTSYHQFLDLQLQAYSSEQSSEADQKLIDAICTLLPCFESDPYLTAEVHFVVGFLYNRANLFQLALHHHYLAIFNYQAAGLREASAIALFNLCVAHNNLNQRGAYEKEFSTLEALASDLPNESVQQVYWRLSAYRAVDLENYDLALNLLEKAIPSFECSGRLRDVGGLICLKAYALTARDGFIDLPSLQMSSSFWHESAMQVYKTILDAMSHLAALRFCDSRNVQLAIKAWQRSGISSIFQIFLFDLLARKVERQEDYSLLLRIAYRAIQYSLENTQAIGQVDFRYYKALALIHLGEIEKAEQTLRAFGSSDQTQMSTAKRSKLDHLILVLERQRSLFGGNEKVVHLSLNPLNHSLRLDDVRIDLRKHPTVESFLLMLVQHKEPMTLEQVFMKIYGSAFSPNRHGPRLNSLMNRTRLLVGADTIVRRDGTVSLNPLIQAIVESANELLQPKRLKRQQIILRYLEQATKPVSLRELMQICNSGERTLQLDMATLKAAGLIIYLGKTRGRTYALAKKPAE